MIIWLIDIDLRSVRYLAKVKILPFIYHINSLALRYSQSSWIQRIFFHKYTIYDKRGDKRLLKSASKLQPKKYYNSTTAYVPKQLFIVSLTSFTLGLVLLNKISLGGVIRNCKVKDSFSSKEDEESDWIFAKSKPT